MSKDVHLSKQVLIKAKSNPKRDINNSTSSLLNIVRTQDNSQTHQSNINNFDYDSIKELLFSGLNKNKTHKFVLQLFDELNKCDIVFPSANMDQDPRRRLHREIYDCLETVAFNDSFYDNSLLQKSFKSFVKYFESPFEDYFPWILSMADKNEKQKLFFYNIFYGALNLLLDNDQTFTRDNLFYLKTKFSVHLQDNSFERKDLFLKTMIKIGQKHSSFWNEKYFSEFFPFIYHVYSCQPQTSRVYWFDCLIRPLKFIFKNNLDIVNRLLIDWLEQINVILNEDIVNTNQYFDHLYRVGHKVSSFSELYVLIFDYLEDEEYCFLHLNASHLAYICWRKVAESDQYFITLVKNFLLFSLQPKMLNSFKNSNPQYLQNIFNVNLLNRLLNYCCSISIDNFDNCLCLFELLNVSLNIVCDDENLSFVDFSSFINNLFSTKVRISFFNMNIPEVFIYIKMIVAKLLMIKSKAVQNATLIYNHIIDDMRSALETFKLKGHLNNEELMFCDKNRKSTITSLGLSLHTTSMKQFYLENSDYRMEAVLLNVHFFNEFFICDNSVIFSFALQPNVPDLMIEQFCPFIVAFASTGKYETQTVWLLKQFYNIIKKRNFFINFCVPSEKLENKIYYMKELLIIEPNELVSLKSENKSTKTIIIDEKKPFPQNANHSMNIIKFFTNLLSIQNMNHIAICALECIKEIFNQIIEIENFSLIIDSLKITDLFVNIAYYSQNDTNMKIFNLSLSLLEKFFIICNHHSKYKKVGQVYRKSFLKNILNSNNDIRQNSLKILSLFPFEHDLLDICLWKRFNLNNCQISTKHSGYNVYPEIVHLSKIVILNKCSSQMFTDEMFKHVLDSSFFGRKSLESSSLLFQQFLTLHKADFKLEHSIKETISYFSFIDFKGFDNFKTLSKNLNVSLYWLCWNFVFHAVENRLKTSFGSPQELFSQLSLRITAIVQEEFKDDEKKKLEEDMILMPTETIISVRMSLNILECFAKAMYNAANRGKTTWLTDFSNSTKVKVFFKKNFDVCKDWMNRNRRSVMFLALKCGDYSLVIRNGEELLRDYSNNQNILSTEQIKFVMIIMTKALLYLKASDAIRGYGSWIRKFNIRLEWIDASTLEASQRYEDALLFYEKILLDFDEQTSTSSIPSLFAKNNEFSCDSFISDFVRERIVQCFISLGSYDDALRFRKNNAFSSKNLLNSDIDYSYLKELNRFDFENTSFNLSSETNINHQQHHLHQHHQHHLHKHHHHTSSSSSLSQQQPNNNNNNNKNNKNNNSNNNIHHYHQIWDVHACYHSTQSSLLKIVKNMISSSNYETMIDHNLMNIHELIDLKLNPLISSFYICGDSSEVFPLNRLHKICFALIHWIQNGDENFINEFFKPINNNYSLEDCVFFLKWFIIFRKFPWGNNLKPIEQDLQLEIAKLARKTNNLKLANDTSRKFQKARFGCRDFEDLMKKQFTGDLFQYINESSQIVMSDGETQEAIDLLANTWHAMLERFQFHPNGIIDQKATEEAAKIGILLADFVENQPKLFNSKFDWLLQLHSFQKVNNYFEQIDPRGLGKNWSDLDAERSVRCTGSLLLRAVNISKTLPEAWNRLADWSYKWARRLDDARNAKQDSINTKETRFRNQSEDCEPQTRCYYELSANSYFKYLQYSSECVENVNATLRLLRLILKHAHQLKESIEFGLKSTPIIPWKKIALQLFSRLNHHEAYVRKSITDLLCRIGNDDPQLLIFPTIAGCMNKIIETDEEIFEKENDSEEEEEAHNTQQCYKLLLQSLEQKNSKMVIDTKCFVDELRRITVLWDELWIGTLQNNLQDVMRQIVNLERDIEITRMNMNLLLSEKELFIKEKHYIYFRRILYTLELTKMITLEKAETIHENWFQKVFSKQIDELIDCIKNPESFWEPSKILQIYQTLLQSIRKQSFISISNRLEMHDISSILASLKNTSIPIPGSKVSIQKINNTVTILQTLTKPKKITFVGNDGRLYPHLFKGHEDLHLDERIMQFLSIVNLIMSSSEDISKQRHLLSRARHYSVTPLGNKSGLIEWVSGAQPLYRFYNRWLASRDFVQDILQESNFKVGPVEIFRQKLPKFKLSIENRFEWPEKVLLAIHDELRQETPNDLLFRELWSASMSGLDYWSISQNYMNSCALMSMIGYLLGLGDRHLDNILLDLTTGEMIHIDFNICFEKGKILKVPEKVSCRLTSNIVHALGVTGTDGNFRFVCEKVLKMMRQNREILLTLLEAFVYDPLVDWTPEHEEGYTGAIYGGMRIAQLAAKGKIIPRKQMERENFEALEKLNELMATVDLRQVDWPQIGLQERIDIVRNGEFMFSKVQKEQNTSGTSETKKSRRNAYAISVWKRIKNKFDGRKIVAGEELPFTTAEQVDYIIAQSVDKRNLARMYEGWTSWV